MGLNLYTSLASPNREVVHDNHPAFSHESTSYADYAEKYAEKYDNNAHDQSNHWLRRKIFAIPVALFSAIVKTTYHLVLAIFHGIPKIFTGDSRVLKANLYSLVRDLEEALGWITTLFYDKAGSYLVAEAEYQKNYYVRSCSDDSGYNSDGSEFGDIAPHSPRSVVQTPQQEKKPPLPLTLKDIAKNPTEKEKAMQDWWDTLSTIPDGEDENWEPFEDLAEKEIKGLTKEETSALLPYFPEDLLGYVFADEDKISIAELSAKQVQGMLLKLANADLLHLISKEQLPHLNLSVLKPDHIPRLFPEYDPDGNNQIRFCSLSTEQIQKMLNKFNKFNLFNLLDAIDKDEFQKLNFSELTDSQIGFFLSESARIFTNMEMRLSRFSPEQVEQVRPKLNRRDPRFFRSFRQPLPS